MSTHILVINPTLTFEQFRDKVKAGDIEGISHAPSEQENKDSFCIVNEFQSHLWVCQDGKGDGFSFYRYGYQGIWTHTLRILEDAGIIERFVDEHDDEYDELMEEE